METIKLIAGESTDLWGTTWTPAEINATNFGIERVGMERLIYRGYTARIEYSEEDGCFVGQWAGTGDIIGFHGSSVEELRRALEEVVDFYEEKGGDNEH